MKPGGAGLNQIGRFLSPDPYVQVPEYSQNFNRYSYVLNNPLNGVDPSGFLLITKMFHKKMAWLKENWRTVVVIVVAVLLTIFTAGIGTAAALAAAGTTAAAAAAAGTLAAFAGSMLALAVNGAFIGFVTGGLSAALAGGDLGDVLRGAVVGGISGALTAGMHAVGGTAMMNAANIVGHGIIGGLSNVAMGGKFGDGFLSAAASAATSVSGLTNPNAGIGKNLTLYGRTAIAAAAGGTASVIGGGKFGNGAVTGAMHHLLNAEGVAETAINTGKEYIQSADVAIDYDGDPHAYAPADSGLVGNDYLANAQNSDGALSPNVILHRRGNAVLNEDGYYVSQTSMRLGNNGNQSDYVNGQEVPYIALGNKQITNAKLGDYIMLYNKQNKNYSLVIYADSRGGRNTGIEISPAAARQLGIGFTRKGVTTTQTVVAQLVGRQAHQLAY